MTVTVLDNQCYQDLAIQLTGTVGNALLIARANNEAPSQDIIAGADIIVPEGLINDQDILRYYQANSILPATDLNQDAIDKVIGCEGIGCWRIGLDFIIS